MPSARRPAVLMPSAQPRLRTDERTISDDEVKSGCGSGLSMISACGRRTWTGNNFIPLVQASVRFLSLGGTDGRHTHAAGEPYPRPLGTLHRGTGSPAPPG